MAAAETIDIAYRPASKLSDFQQRVLERMSYTEPTRPGDLRDLGDPRGVGASMRALYDRGLVRPSGPKGKGAYIRRRTPRPRVNRFRAMYLCPKCERLFHPFEVAEDLSGHDKLGDCRGGRMQIRAGSFCLGTFDQPDDQDET